MAEPIAALIVRILADTSEMVSGVKNVSGQLDSLESRVSQFGKVLAGVFSISAAAGFFREIVSDIDRVANAAKNLGTTSEEFQRFSYAIRQSGGDAESATTAIMSLTDRLGSGDTGLFNVLRKLNINLDEFKSKDAVSRFVALATAINGVADPTKQLELRMEALGTKGVAALTAVDESFKQLAANAPTYSQETVDAVKRADDAWQGLWDRIKVGSAESLMALKDFLDFSKTMMIDPDTGAPKFFSGSGDVRDIKNPTPNRNLPDPLGFGGVDPNNVRELALAYADLNLKAIEAANAQKELKEQWDSSIAVLKMLKIEAPTATDAIGKLMDRMDTSTKVDNMANRILGLAQRIAALRDEGERLMESINPGSTKLAGDDVDAEIFKLRSDSRNWGKDGNLTAQALEIEHRLINNFNLRMMANQLTPTSVPSVSGYSNVPGFTASVNSGPAVTVNAQGAFLMGPEAENRIARLVEDAIAKRGMLRR